MNKLKSQLMDKKYNQRSFNFKYLRLKLWEKQAVDKAISFLYVFFISHLLLTSHQRSTLIPLDTGTPGTSREDTVGMPMGRLKLCWYQEYLCPMETMYLSDEKQITDGKL